MSLKDQLAAAGGPTAEAETSDLGLRLARLEAELRAVRRQLRFTRTLALVAIAGVVGLVLRGLFLPV